jgi:predicted patatin/cPLA2 family phospholipase
VGHPVIDLIVDRIGSGSRPGERRDGAVVALVAEGGGMRGVVSGGMVTALHELGARDAFDVVVGTSAGALAGAYFLADQPALGTSIYYEDLVTGEFINWRRALRGGDLMSVDFLLDVVMRERKVLDTEAVLRSTTPLHAVVTRVADYQSVTLGSFVGEAEMREALRASARIPLASGAPVEIGDASYIDGSIIESVPFRSALAGGATHVLALLTRPKGELRGAAKAWQKSLLFPIMNRRTPGLGDAHLPRAARYKSEMLELERMNSASEVPCAYSIQIPEGGIKVAQLEQDPAILFQGAAAGAAAVYLALTGSSPEFFRALSVY